MMHAGVKLLWREKICGNGRGFGKVQVLGDWKRTEKRIYAME